MRSLRAVALAVAIAATMAPGAQAADTTASSPGPSQDRGDPYAARCADDATRRSWAPFGNFGTLTLYSSTGAAPAPPACRGATWAELYRGGTRWTTVTLTRDTPAATVSNRFMPNDTLVPSVMLDATGACITVTATAEDDSSGPGWTVRLPTYCGPPPIANEVIITPSTPPAPPAPAPTPPASPAAPAQTKTVTKTKTVFMLCRKVLKHGKRVVACKRVRSKKIKKKPAARSVRRVTART